MEHTCLWFFGTQHFNFELSLLLETFFGSCPGSFLDTLNLNFLMVHLLEFNVLLDTFAYGIWNPAIVLDQ